ncbi:UDP-glycosyltransferase 90A1-like [Olea europaea var. sylvestris]|uniref:UDP-glycosyltransferase 90A1-like n=1 Tax=Olea europaea var. sylvestris TaxID=158386 RepID=UPI000C1D1DDD|nr:UDP-glycosyltransferase 90A1-like [Olea europaea var. sylvestris]
MSLLSSYNPKPHVVLFPFMSKGHTIPLLQLARLLLCRGCALTLFTTPENRPYIVQSLSGDDITIIDLPFPGNIPGIPPGIESTDKLPSMSLFFSFARATKLMQPYFEGALQKIPHVTCIVSDLFLHWTVESAIKFGVQQLGFDGMSNYVNSINRDAVINGLLSLHESADEPFTLSSFPWIKLTRNDFDYPFNQRHPSGPLFDFIMEMGIALSKSYGLLVNSFYELEPLYVEYWNRESKAKAFCVGPLCMARPPKMEPVLHQECRWIKWLDQKLAKKKPVLYVAFGSQAEISSTQLTEIARGLEESKVSFLWVVRKSGRELGDEFEDRIKERGIIVKEWVDQKRILEHEIVQGFLSHCGWNSVLESISAEVPILAWPMMAEQPLNAKMVVEEIKIGLRVETVNGSGNKFVQAESFKNKVKELMEGEKGEEVRKKVKQVAEAARNSMMEGGSSWHTLNQLIKEIYLQNQPEK